MRGTVFLAVTALLLAGCSAPPAKPVTDPAPPKNPEVPPTKYVNASTALALTKPTMIGWPGSVFGVGERPTDCVEVTGDGIIANQTKGSFTFRWDAQHPALEEMTVMLFTGQPSWFGGERSTISETTGTTGLSVSFEAVRLHQAKQGAPEGPNVYLYAWIYPTQAGTPAYQQTVDVSYSLPFESGIGVVPPNAEPTNCDSEYMPEPRLS